MGSGQRQSTAEGSGVSIEAIKANTEQLAAACSALKAEREARTANVNPKRPGEAELSRLDSSIKKNGAFIKKLRQLSADNRQQLLAEAAKLNLSKYVSEAVAAMADVPLKTSDIPAAVDMAAALHGRYPDFSASLGSAVAKVAVGTKGPSEDDRLAGRRQRAALRLLPELLAAGIVADASGMLGVVKTLVTSLDFDKEREASMHTATLLGGVVKSAASLLLGGLPDAAANLPLPRELLHDQDLSSLPADLAAAVTELQMQQKQLEEEMQQRYQLPQEQQQLLVKMFDRAFEVCSAALVESHKSLLALDRDNAKAFATKGELPEGAAAEYETQRKAYEGLHRSTAAMAEALNKPLPDLAEDAFTRLGADEGPGAAGAAAGGSAGGADQVEQVFEDPEARAFYEQLPDLWSLVPTVLLKDATQPRKTSEPSGSSTAAAEPGSSSSSSEVTAAAADAGSIASASGSNTASTCDSVGASTPAAAAPENSEASEPAAAAAADADDTSSATVAADHSSAVDVILSRLTSCVSRDLCDELAVNFCYSNSKGARKKLVRALVDVPRGNLQLLPYYARVAATISQAYPEVAAGLLSAVEAEFDYLAAKKDLTQRGEEPWLRVARYIAELAKFRLAPPSAVLLRVKALLDDFSGPTVDAAAALVESAGRFLLRLPESRVRMENLLGVMMRLKNARNLDSRQSNAIDSAYFACRPPDKATQRRRRPPLQEYVRYLIFEQLSDGSIVEVLKKLMKLPWPECEPYLLKCLLKVSRVRFQHIALIASLAGGLAQYHDSIGVGLVDLVLEDVRWGLDHPTQGNYQQRLAQVRLLGETYNYMLLDSRAVFDVLYLLIGHGHDAEETAMKLDPPDDFFRVRLVIALLSTCGSYFSKGAAKRRLDRFLTFMQAYVAAKQPLPLDVEADLQDLYDSLRPCLVRFSSYTEAAAAVQDILAKEAAASASGLEPIEEEDSDEEERSREQQPAAAEAQGDDVDDGSGDGMDDYDRGATGDEDAEFDDEFEKEYLSLLQDCQGRPGAPSAAAAAAASSSSSSVQATHLQQRHAQHDDDGEDETPAITFKLLMKKGGKDDRSRELQVPADAAIAVRLMAKQQSEAAEREQIKALVLEANQRDEAEQQAAAAAEAAAARAAQPGRRARGKHQGGLYKYQTPGGGARGAQRGPALTLRQHVSQLTGEKE